MSISVQRDPFARGEYRRECVSNKAFGPITCSWCGQERKRVFIYRWAKDDNNRPGLLARFKPMFCNFECFKSYHS